MSGDRRSSSELLALFALILPWDLRVQYELAYIGIDFQGVAAVTIDQVRRRVRQPKDWTI
jgi:hypothetical protein